MNRLPLLRHMLVVPLFACLTVFAAIVALVENALAEAFVCMVVAIYPMVRSFKIWSMYQQYRVLIVRRHEIGKALPNRQINFHRVYQHRASGMIFYISYKATHTFIWCLSWEEFCRAQHEAKQSETRRATAQWTIYHLSAHNGNISRAEASIWLRVNGERCAIDPVRIPPDFWDSARQLSNQEVFAQLDESSLVLVERLGAIAVRFDRGVIGGRAEFRPLPPLAH